MLTKTYLRTLSVMRLDGTLQLYINLKIYKIYVLEKKKPADSKILNFNDVLQQVNLHVSLSRWQSHYLEFKIL